MKRHEIFVVIKNKVVDTILARDMEDIQRKLKGIFTHGFEVYSKDYNTITFVITDLRVVDGSQKAAKFLAKHAKPVISNQKKKK